MTLFQNEITSHLISRIQMMNDIPVDAIAVAYESSDPGTEIRRPMMEGMLWLLHGKNLDCERLKAFDGVPRFMSALTGTQHHAGHWVDDKWVEQLSYHLSEYMLRGGSGRTLLSVAGRCS
jgi:hypothetical protein